MIQLATDPNASRAGWRPSTSAEAAKRASAPRARAGHAWPFLSKLAERPATPDSPKPGGQDGGS
ncbi:hypothetical protein JI739_13575 [Ramlibacter sp. AW1]|uniref:Uncharacterized protein n=1 Tax=Ramlibacter aurantiacus TaxID=2801330 RepID=A0A937D299_9BURK|nr:hypothetical protein [Ramlibacter aurantiacus]MBL0421384.1 hypothetical protein [Ramlibacter aurantiacus]